MAQQTITNGNTLADVRADLNANFTELYGSSKLALTDTVTLSGTEQEWDVTGDEVRIVGEDVTRTASGATRIQVSYDDGVSWENTNYKFAFVEDSGDGIVTAGETGVNVYSTSTAAGQFLLSFFACKANAYTIFDGYRWVDADPLIMKGHHGTAGIVNRMRLMIDTGGGTFSAGSLYVFQR